MNLNGGDAVVEWKYYSGILNKEFGGKHLKHCGFLSGAQFGVIPGFLIACGSATHKNGAPTICEYREPTIFPNNFLTGLSKIIRENQTKTGPCVGCRYLIPTKMPSEFVSGYISSISLHDFCGCNSQCVYCGGSEYYLPEKYIASFDHEVLFRNLLKKKMVKPGFASVTWGGGEPTLLNTFEKTVNFLRINRIRQTINTSGICFSPAIEKVLSYRMAAVRISVDSGTNETYIRVKRNQYCDNVWESIRRYCATGGNFIVKYIVFSMNSDIEEVDCFVNRCQKAGVKRICISVDARSVYTGVSDAGKITLKELVAASLIYNLANSKKITSYFEGIWLPEQIKSIEQIGNFNPKRSQRNLFARIFCKIRKMAVQFPK